MGAEGCACTDGGGCDVGLACRSKLCAETGGDGYSDADTNMDADTDSDTDSDSDGDYGETSAVARIHHDLHEFVIGLI